MIYRIKADERLGIMRAVTESANGDTIILECEEWEAGSVSMLAGMLMDQMRILGKDVAYEIATAMKGHA